MNKREQQAMELVWLVQRRGEPVHWSTYWYEYNALRRVGHAVTHHNERVCSCDWYQGEAKAKGERRVELAQQRARAILANYRGLAVDFGSGDPRLCGLIVYVDDGQPYEYGRQQVAMSV